MRVKGGGVWARDENPFWDTFYINYPDEHTLENCDDWYDGLANPSDDDEGKQQNYGWAEWRACRRFPITLHFFPDLIALLAADKVESAAKI